MQLDKEAFYKKYNLPNDHQKMVSTVKCFIFVAILGLAANYALYILIKELR